MMNKELRQTTCGIVNRSRAGFRVFASRKVQYGLIKKRFGIGNRTYRHPLAAILKNTRTQIR